MPQPEQTPIQKTLEALLKKCDNNHELLAGSLGTSKTSIGNWTKGTHIPIKAFQNHIKALAKKWGV